MKISAVEHNFSHQPILIPAYPSMGPGVEKKISCLSQSIGIGAHVCEDHKDLGLMQCINSILVVFHQPIWKSCEPQNGFIFPQFEGLKKHTYLKPPPVHCIVICTTIKLPRVEWCMLPSISSPHIKNEYVQCWSITLRTSQSWCQFCLELALHLVRNEES